MMKKIEISDSTFLRLEGLVVGFDSPESVIIRLLDLAEYKNGENSEAKPTIVFSPNDETKFKQLLVRFKRAEVVIYKHDGTREILQWNASKLTESSNLRRNLWSGFLRDWKKKNISSIQLSIYPLPEHHDDIQAYELHKELSVILGLTFEELVESEYEINTNESDDGQIYDYIVRFYDDCDQEILNRIDGINDNNEVTVAAHLLNSMN